MLYRRLVDLVILVHLGFVVFVLLGGLLVLKHKRVMWLHLPAVLWAALLEFTGRICPLTPLENWLRQKSGASLYHTGFIEHYLLPLLYPDRLTRQMQIMLGVLVLALNLGIYCWLWFRSVSTKDA
ncbi:MAG: hypothetical protein A2Y80_00895 [Deltaproteobacteria bacterium RBG_13_58_19]|nr:MAG: hypothetical protein A2Y80_00895 [Deltaproteobacteria bacterium RBG_13_58_19]